jgi:hypothetical protein
LVFGTPGTINVQDVPNASFVKCNWAWICLASERISRKPTAPSFWIEAFGQANAVIGNFYAAAWIARPRSPAVL